MSTLAIVTIVATISAILHLGIGVFAPFWRQRWRCWNREFRIVWEDGTQERIPSGRGMFFEEPVDIVGGRVLQGFLLSGVEGGNIPLINIRFFGVGEKRYGDKIPFLLRSWPDGILIVPVPQHQQGSEGFTAEIDTIDYYEWRGEKRDLYTHFLFRVTGVKQTAAEVV